MLYDFHTHTFLSDGVLAPVELIQRACVKGYTAIAVTDHWAVDQERVLGDPGARVRDGDEEMGSGHSRGGADARAAGEDPRGGKAARSLGAQIVIATGRASWSRWRRGPTGGLESPRWTWLAHPGLLSEEEARLAAEGGTSCCCRRGEATR